MTATSLIYPGSAGRCGPPLRRAVSFLGSCLQRLSANHFAPSGIPHRSHSAVKRVGEPATSCAALERVGAQPCVPVSRPSSSGFRPSPVRAVVAGIRLLLSLPHFWLRG